MGLWEEKPEKIRPQPLFSQLLKDKEVIFTFSEDFFLFLVPFQTFRSKSSLWHW